MILVYPLRPMLWIAIKIIQLVWFVVGYKCLLSWRSTAKRTWCLRRVECTFRSRMKLLIFNYPLRVIIMLCPIIRNMSVSLLATVILKRRVGTTVVTITLCSITIYSIRAVTSCSIGFTSITFIPL